MKIVAGGNCSSLTISMSFNCDCKKTISKDEILDLISSMEEYISDVRKFGNCTSKNEEIKGASDIMEDVIREFKQEKMIESE